MIDTQSLAELLEVDFDTWDSTLSYEYRERLYSDSGDHHPVAENLGLLMDHIPRKRYLELASLAEAIEDQPSEEDITLTEREEQILQAAYHLAHCSGEGITVFTQTLRSTTGIELSFESTDTGAWSPYEVEQGKGFDSGDDFVPVDESLDGLLDFPCPPIYPQAVPKTPLFDTPRSWIEK